MKISKFSSMTSEQKTKTAKYFSALVILVIIAFYSISFAISSNNYNVNKIYGDILDSGKIYSGVYIGEVYVGGLTREQAEKAAQTAYADKRLDSYTMTFKTDYGYDKTYTYRELGAEYDIEKAIKDAYNINRSGSRSERIASLDEIEGRGEHISVDYSINESVLKDTINGIADDVDKEYSLVDKQVNYDRTYEMVYSYLQIQENGVELYVPEVVSSEE